MPHSPWTTAGDELASGSLMGLEAEATLGFLAAACGVSRLASGAPPGAALAGMQGAQEQLVTAGGGAGAGAARRLLRSAHRRPVPASRRAVRAPRWGLGSWDQALCQGPAQC